MYNLLLINTSLCDCVLCSPHKKHVAIAMDKIIKITPISQCICLSKTLFQACSICDVIMKHTDFWYFVNFTTTTNIYPILDRLNVSKGDKIKTKYITTNQQTTAVTPGHNPCTRITGVILLSVKSIVSQFIVVKRNSNFTVRSQQANHRTSLI